MSKCGVNTNWNDFLKTKKLKLKITKISKLQEFVW